MCRAKPETPYILFPNPIYPLYSFKTSYTLFKPPILCPNPIYFVQTPFTLPELLYSLHSPYTLSKTPYDLPKSSLLCPNPLHTLRTPFTQPEPIRRAFYVVGAHLHCKIDSQPPSASRTCIFYANNAVSNVPFYGGRIVNI